MKTAKLAVALLMVSSLVTLSGCGKLIDKLKGVSEDAGEDAAVAEVVDAGAAETAEVDAGPDAAAVVVKAGDNIPTFNADETAAQKDIGVGNYKTQLQTLDTEVKALK